MPMVFSQFLASAGRRPNCKPSKYTMSKELQGLRNHPCREIESEPSILKIHGHHFELPHRLGEIFSYCARKMATTAEQFENGRVLGAFPFLMVSQTTGAALCLKETDPMNENI